MSDTDRLATRGMSAHLWEEPKQMLEIDDVALWYALNRLMTNYWVGRGSQRGQPGARVLFAGGALRGRQQPVRRTGKDPCLLCSAATARHHHHASPGRQSSGIAGRCGLRPDGRGDEPLPRRWPPTLSVDKTARHGCGFRSPMRARRRPDVAFSVARPAANFRRQRPSGFDLDRPPTPLRAPKDLTPRPSDGAVSLTARNSPISGFRLPAPA